uniref:Peptidase M41 FtsH extracellular domain-containing protein n=1 Tax=Oryza rufipogon TaxID=4529 RepID=A0A0E0N9V4_ORYRU
MYKLSEVTTLTCSTSYDLVVLVLWPRASHRVTGHGATRLSCPTPATTTTTTTSNLCSFLNRVVSAWLVCAVLTLFLFNLLWFYPVDALWNAALRSVVTSGKLGKHPSMAGGGEEARCDYWEGRWVAPIVLAFLLLAVRLALPKNAAKEVAYSDLLTGLRAGDVTAVAFEEDSRRIYFHRATDDVGGGGGRSASAARWLCYTRRVPHDEGFLLGLMRDGGVDYRSAPRLAGRLLVYMLSTLLALWVDWWSGGGGRVLRSPMTGEAAGEAEKERKG